MYRCYCALKSTPGIHLLGVLNVCTSGSGDFSSLSSATSPPSFNTRDANIPHWIFWHKEKPRHSYSEIHSQHSLKEDLLKLFRVKTVWWWLLLLLSRSAVSDSWRPHGLQPTRLLGPWDFPGKSTGVGCHCLLPTVVDLTAYTGTVSHRNLLAVYEGFYE